MRITLKILGIKGRPTADSAPSRSRSGEMTDEDLGEGLREEGRAQGNDGRALQ